MERSGNLVYEDLVGRGKKVITAKSWCRLVERFELVCGVKAKYEREDVIKFLVDCRRRGLNQNSINSVLRPIKLMAEIQGWDFPRLSMPKVRDSDMRRPLLSAGEVCLLIRRGKEVLVGRELAYVALSTTYGLRRGELGTVGLKKDGEGNGSVVVRTVKGGPETKHIIPYEIKEYLEMYSGIGDNYVTKVFGQIMRKCDIELNGPGYGWHSVRRALVTGLVGAEVGMLNIVRFMRWSDRHLRSEFDMVAVYACRDQGKIDRAIFEAHPFLNFWKEG